MKRDMDLVRKILLAIEENPQGFFNKRLLIEGYSAEQIGYHVYLMMQAGLVEGADATTMGCQSPVAIPTGLTWQGHDFLDACRDEGVWAKAKEKLKSLGGEVPLEVVKTVLIEIMKKQVLGI
jgi:hypothetical protein